MNSRPVTPRCARSALSRARLTYGVRGWLQASAWYPECMATSREDLYRAVLNLNEGERAELAGLLIESLDSETEEGVEAAWIMEIERRIKQLDSGTVEAIPWADVRARLHRRVGG